MRKKMDCSKKILVVSYSIAIFLTLFMLTGIVLALDISPIENICLASWGEVTVANSFYYIKSKVENRIKLIGSLPEELKEQVDINQIINQ